MLEVDIENRFQDFCSNHKFVFIVWMGLIILLALIIYGWELLKRRLFSVYNFSKISLLCMKVAVLGHLYQAQLLGWGCSREELHVKKTVFHRASINFLAKAGRILTSQLVTARRDKIISLILTKWAVMSPLLCQSSSVMLVASLKPNFSQIVSVPHFLGAWFGHWSLFAEVLKTLTSATDINRGKCFENS